MRIDKKMRKTVRYTAIKSGIILVQKDTEKRYQVGKCWKWGLGEVTHDNKICYEMGYVKNCHRSGGNRMFQYMVKYNKEAEKVRKLRIILQTYEKTRYSNRPPIMANNVYRAMSAKRMPKRRKGHFLLWQRGKKRWMPR